MLITYGNKIIEKTLYSFYEDGTFGPPKRLEKKKYNKPFNLLKNWDLVRTFAINKHKLISNYIHLLEQEKFDEN